MFNIYNFINDLATLGNGIKSESPIFVKMESEFTDLKDNDCLKKHHNFWTKTSKIEHSEWKQDWLTRQASTKVTMKTRLLP